MLSALLVKLYLCKRSVYTQGYIGWLYTGLNGTYYSFV